MTRSSLRDAPRILTPPTTRFTRWGSWLVFCLLVGHLIFCHGCHGDEDNELCVPPSPAAREIPDSQSQILNSKQEFGI
jgi:hypothetical protein